jgi:hypothetical protein
LPGSWSVVVTVRTRKPILDQFLAHYLSLGAERIFLYFDDPAMAWPYDDPRIEVTICDDAYWSKSCPPDAPRRAGVRPVRVIGRQVRNGNIAKAKTASEWLFHTDVDELLVCQEPVQSLLATVPADFNSVRIDNVEAVYTREPTQHTAFDTDLFRRQVRGKKFPPALPVWLVMGELAPLTKRGLLGHALGKSFFRVAGSDGIQIHRLKQAAEGFRFDYRLPKLLLLHFDCLAYEEFRAKHVRRIQGITPVPHMSDHRKVQMRLIALVLKWRGEPGLRRLYRRLYIFRAWRLRLAMRLGYIVRIQVSPGPLPPWPSPRVK